MERVEGTAADREAWTYENNGMSRREAWDMVLRNFEERMDGLVSEMKRQAEHHYFLVKCAA
ncbi:MAG: hypothetical protein ACRBBP_05190 [Bdellovibrionales bacterium]